MKVIEDLPRTFLHLEEFITPFEEQTLLNCVYAVPKPKWTSLRNRRAQNWGGIPHRGKALLCSERIPDWLERVIDKVEATTGLFDNCRPNHVLINEYLPGQGILPHTDGPLYTPVVANLSLGSHTILKILGRQDRELRGEIFLQPRSLLITKDEAYSDYLHGIDEVAQDLVHSSVIGAGVNGETSMLLKRQTRVSLTIRHVAKVIFVGSNRKQK